MSVDNPTLVAELPADLDVEFAPELADISLFLIMRSAQSKVTALEFPTWDEDELPDYSLPQLMYALAARVPEMEPSTLQMLIGDYAYALRWRMTLDAIADEQALAALAILHSAVTAHPAYVPLPADTSTTEV